MPQGNLGCKGETGARWTVGCGRCLASSREGLTTENTEETEKEGANEGGGIHGKREPHELPPGFDIPYLQFLQFLPWFLVSGSRFPEQVTNLFHFGL